MPAEKILIYGGSFDPPHKGHLKLLQGAIDRINPDRVYLLPAYRSPFKELPLTSFRERARMIQLAVAEAFPASLCTRIRIHPFEMLRECTTYTWQALRYFRKKHPEAVFFLLLGSDCLCGFRSWKRCGEIRSSCTLVVGKRPGTTLRRQQNCRFRFELLPGRFPAVSSSQLREQIYSDGKMPDSVPASVSRYIAFRGLYGTVMRAWLKKNLPPGRFRHTLSVTGLSQRLAACHGADPGFAAVAALLHDAGRSLPDHRLAGYAGKRRLQVARMAGIIKNQPGLLHSHVSADIARRIFGVKSPAILSAIRLHTLGSGKMSLLDKIIYVADIAAEDRKFKGALKIRNAAFSDLDKAVLMAAQAKLNWVLATEKWIHPSGVELWNTLNQRY
ncbi:MAG: nicotinate (nicotinamide) nucleotide adenylyltransferase [bacterium]